MYDDKMLAPNNFLARLLSERILSWGSSNVNIYLSDCSKNNSQLTVGCNHLLFYKTDGGNSAKGCL